MENDDWLDAPLARTDEPLNLPAVVTLPDDYRARAELAEACWARLTIKQKMFLGAWRDCNYRIHAASKLSGVHRNTHYNSLHTADYATVVRVWTASAAGNALDRDRLLARQESIIEEALTPKPILHMGEPTGFEEVNLSVAARANEVLLDRAVPKPRDSLELNVGVAFSPVQVEVAEAPGNTIDVTAEVVEAGPILPAEDWLS